MYPDLLGYDLLDYINPVDFYADPYLEMYDYMPVYEPVVQTPQIPVVPMPAFTDTKSLVKEAKALAASQEVIVKLAEELAKRPHLAELLRLVLNA